MLPEDSGSVRLGLVQDEGLETGDLQEDKRGGKRGGGGAEMVVGVEEVGSCSVDHPSVLAYSSRATLKKDYV